MEKLKTIKAAYSYYAPEVREVISNLTKDFPHSVFLKSIEPGLDDFHTPIMKRLVEYQKESIHSLNKYKYMYPTSGAEEAIRETMSLITP